MPKNLFALNSTTFAPAARVKSFSNQPSLETNVSSLLMVNLSRETLNFPFNLKIGALLVISEMLKLVFYVQSSVASSKSIEVSSSSLSKPNNSI